MYLRYIPANRAWVFLFGHDINSATIQDMGNYGRFFNTRGDAIAAARMCGLRVDKAGSVSISAR